MVKTAATSLPYGLNKEMLDELNQEEQNLSCLRSPFYAADGCKRQLLLRDLMERVIYSPNVLPDFSRRRIWTLTRTAGAESRDCMRDKKSDRLAQGPAAIGSGKVFRRFVKASLAYALAGFAVPSLWPLLASPFGYLAGFAAAVLIIAPLWYLVHYRGMAELHTGDIAVDMGGGIAAAVFTRDALYQGLSEMLAALPTVALMLIGACLGALLAFYVEKKWIGGKK